MIWRRSLSCHEALNSTSRVAHLDPWTQVDMTCYQTKTYSAHIYHPVSCFKFETTSRDKLTMAKPKIIEHQKHTFCCR